MLVFVAVCSCAYCWMFVSRSQSASQLITLLCVPYKIAFLVSWIVWLVFAIYATDMLFAIFYSSTPALCDPKVVGIDPRFQAIQYVVQDDSTCIWFLWCSFCVTMSFSLWRKSGFVVLRLVSQFNFWYPRLLVLCVQSCYHQVGWFQDMKYENNKYTDKVIFWEQRLQNDPLFVR